MRLLVTGGAGRLGVGLIRLISKRGHTAIAFDLPQTQLEPLEAIPRVEAFMGDITRPADVAEACGGVDAVFHLAAILPPRSEENPELTRRVNVEGTRNLLETLKRRPAPIIFSSSVAVYGVTALENPPIPEDHPVAGTDNYSNSKIEAERLIKASSIPYTILRISPIALADIVEPPETIPFRFDQRVEFIYLEDAARALLSALERPEARGRTLNIAGGDSWQVTGGEYMRSLYESLGVEAELKFSRDYTALDWYDTRAGSFLGYQRTSMREFLEILKRRSEELGLR
jgi:nucleoside-diphosphate-sugar epimerase